MTFDPTDADRRPADRESRRLLALVVAALGLAALARFGYLGHRFVNDPGLYMAMGKAVVEGRQLYVEIWDTKLPGITLLTAPLYAVLRDRWWAYVVLQFAMMILGVAALAGAAARVAVAAGANTSSVRRARLATAAVGLVLLNIHWLLVTGFQLETPMLVCASLGAWATVRALAEPATGRAVLWAVLAGVGGGMAATLKPTALAVSGAAVVALLELARRGELPRALRLALGLGAGLALMLAVNVAWYTYLKVWPLLGEVTREISLYGTGTPWSQILTFKTALILFFLTCPAAVALVAALALPRRGDAPRDHASPGGAAIRSAALVLAVVWLAVEIAGTILQKRGYAYHFLPIAAPATLLAGLLVVAAGRRLRALPLVLALGVAPAAGYTLFTGVAMWRTLLSRERTYPVDLVNYVREHTKPGDTIFADPLGELVVMTDRRPGSRVGMLIYFVNHDAAPEKFSSLLLSDLEERKCDVICLPLPAVLEGRIAGWEKQQVLRDHPARREAYRAAWQRFIDYVHANYTLEDPDVDGRQIWRRIPSGGSIPSGPTTQP